METHVVHERLHRQRHFSAIADGTIAAEDFDWLMTRMGGFYAALDPMMTAACRRIGAGTGGYRYHARTPKFPNITGGVPALPEIGNLAALAGAAYTVDGAVLGGQLLRQSIAGRLDHPYWDWCATAGKTIWHDARALIDLADTDPGSVGCAIDVAKAVFSAFHDHMDAAPAEVAP